ncbi:HupE/UreJ family protein [Roseibium alexandrii]|uniref:Hydrogenase/urease accessory protein n=1 Tax=Roseibium alexandrii (strain DSM 17067 / NCIMB 14079 / DFL-11) TaxID=244592 RepID=A0A5E8GWX7_ROSAD|nr:HupE/UreJ family protein [Roseibium alexandrii]EEE44242.2 Hydrogenase/urease accessory protein [Roseibium alexandrii DFL-11]
MTKAFPVAAFVWMALAVWFWPAPASAHSLGVDKAELIETAPGAYELLSKVPPRLASAITTPVLPGQCTFEGSPRGERGAYHVLFRFTCETSLTSDDQLVLPWKRDGALLTVRWFEQEPLTRLATRQGDAIVVDLEEYLAGSGSIVKAATRYTKLGFEHILEGLDHLLFVFALMIVVRNGWRLVKTITAFTIAHSITLALATLGYVNLPSAPVEATIALSIVFLCVEIVHAARGQISLTYRYPWIVAFAFGLLHGLGFAGALSEIGLPPNEIPIALLFFNIGVELGQLAFVSVILIALNLLAALRFRFPRWAELVPTYVIGTLAMYWTLERTAAIAGL